MDQSLLGLDTARPQISRNGSPEGRIAMSDRRKARDVDAVRLHRICAGRPWARSQELLPDSLRGRDDHAALSQMQRHDLEQVIVEHVVGVTTDAPRHREEPGCRQREEGPFVEEVRVQIGRTVRVDRRANANACRK